jgi:IclR family acetate operon transcriptional repressor
MSVEAMMATKESARVQSLDRGLHILMAVSQSGREMSLGELTKIMQLDRSSVYRLANTLRLRGLLCQSEINKSYSLGPAVWQLAGQMRQTSRLLNLSREHVDALAAATGETAHLATREKDRVVFLDYALNSYSVGVSVGSGRVEPLHCTALGKALLLDYDATQLTEILGSAPLCIFTEKTITTISDLAKDCELAAQRGYAVDDMEFREGVRCIAAPIRNSDGKIAAAIGLSAPSTRLTKSRRADIAQSVVQAATEVSKVLGFVASEAIHAT